MKDLVRLIGIVLGSASGLAIIAGAALAWRYWEIFAPLAILAGLCGLALVWESISIVWSCISDGCEEDDDCEEGKL